MIALNRLKKLNQIQLDSLNKIVAFISGTITVLILVVTQVYSWIEPVYGNYFSIYNSVYDNFKIDPKVLSIGKDSLRLNESKIKDIFQYTTYIGLYNGTNHFVYNIKIPLSIFVLVDNNVRYCQDGYYCLDNSQSLMHFSTNDVIYLKQIPPKSSYNIHVYSPIPLFENKTFNFEYSNKNGKIFPSPYVTPENSFDNFCTLHVLNNKYIQLILWFCCLYIAIFILIKITKLILIILRKL